MPTSMLVGAPSGGVASDTPRAEVELNSALALAYSSFRLLSAKWGGAGANCFANIT